jgi:hypothetical protein
MQDIHRNARVLFANQNPRKEIKPMTDICIQCGKDKVADYPECGLILDDLATPMTDI